MVKSGAALLLLLIKITGRMAIALKIARFVEAFTLTKRTLHYSRIEFRLAFRGVGTKRLTCAA
jgi:hypothetical protein